MQLQHGQPNGTAPRYHFGVGKHPCSTDPATALWDSVCFLVVEIQKGSLGSSFRLTPSMFALLGL